ALVEVIDVLGEAGGVDGAVVGALRRERGVGRRLADIVEAGPDERTRDEGPGRVVAVRILSGVAEPRRLVVVGRSLSVGTGLRRRVGYGARLREIDAPAAHGRRGLGSEQLPGGIGGMVGVVIAGVGRVVVAGHVQQLGDVAVVSLGDVGAAHLVRRPGHGPR